MRCIAKRAGCEELCKDLMRQVTRQWNGKLNSAEKNVNWQTLGKIVAAVCGKWGTLIWPSPFRNEITASKIIPRKCVQCSVMVPQSECSELLGIQKAYTGSRGRWTSTYESSTKSCQSVELYQAQETLWTEEAGSWENSGAMAQTWSVLALLHPFMAIVGGSTREIVGLSR